MDDITEDQMMKMYAITAPMSSYQWGAWSFFECDIRTNLLIKMHGMVLREVKNLEHSFESTSIEIFCGARNSITLEKPNYILKANGSMRSTFGSCYKIRGVYWIDVINVKDFYLCFHACSNLRTLYLVGLNGPNINTSFSPLLDYNSFEICIRYAYSKQGTWTVHPTSYNLLTGTSTKDKYEETGHTMEEWTAITAQALEKQIKFITV